MGSYLNPGNDGFRAIRNSDYVDKSGLIAYMNSTIEKSPDRLTSFSRPRRFGKSFAAKMLCAYYDKSCDSRQLFEDLEIAACATFEKYLNQYDVIYLDITWFISTAHDIGNVVNDLQNSVVRELKETFPDIARDEETSLPRVMSAIALRTGKKFIVIIDEWDALFREAKYDDALQKEYVRLLRGLFKSGPVTDMTIAAAYMTGILPIKKYGTESALTDFQEYTVTNPDILAPYVGFTEPEVKSLCDENNIDFDKMKQWYDGYSFENLSSVYNPNSVMSAIKRKNFRSYWTSSETYTSLKGYITQNLDGLRDAVIQMLGGGCVNIDISTFQNDVISFHSKDDVLTLLVHLGYVAYDGEKKEGYIPNLEVADAFRTAVKETDWKAVNQALARSDDLLRATIRKDSDAVAVALENIHSAETSVLQYNDENSLSCALTIAYYTARNYYMMIREFPAGKGFADIAFIPRPNSDKPAMIIELKYDKDADSAINQIKRNRYSGALKDYAGKILLVGINYDKTGKGKNAKKHTCVIEEA
ncbi:MAG: ATP-binding protein [Clostridiales bacterium]|nr:ATP-binding protein [Clostridiales bacterium]